SFYAYFFFFFFFSSRRRHTRFSRDWSSDVCSSDLWSTVMALRPTSCWSAGKRFPDVGGEEVVVVVHQVSVVPGWAGSDKGQWKRSEERRVGKECRSRWARNH